MASMSNVITKLQRISRSPYLTTFFRLILGVLFLYAGIEKIIHTEVFAITIQNYQLIPVSYTNLIAIVLPWLEFYCGLLLLLGWRHQMAAFWVTLMNIVFLIGLSSAYVRGLDIDCGCFGTGSSINLTRILEDFLLLAFSLHILFFPASLFALDNHLQRKQV